MNSTPDDPQDETGGDPAEQPDAAPGHEAPGPDRSEPAPPDPDAPEQAAAEASIPPPAPPGPVIPPGTPPAGADAPYGVPTYAPPPGYAYPVPEKKGLSFGGGIGIGVGIGCGAYLLGGALLLAGLGIIGNTFGWLWPFIAIAVVAIVMMFFRRTRAIATGMLIASAAAWIIVIGPCLAIISGF